MGGCRVTKSKVELTEITSLGEFLALRAVQVKPRQRRFTKPALLSWMQNRHPAVTSYAIKLDGELIGYVMLIHAENPTQWIIERLTIGVDYQRQGHGYAVCDHLIDMIHGFENSEMVIARYAPENMAGRKLFAKLGFVEREEMFRGRHVSLLEFEFEEDEDDADEADDEEDAADADESDDYEEANDPDSDEENEIDSDRSA